MTEPRNAPDAGRVREAMRDAGGGEPDPPPSHDEVAGGQVGNSAARFVEPTEEDADRAREDPEHPGASGSEAEPGSSGAGRN